MANGGIEGEPGQSYPPHLGLQLCDMGPLVGQLPRLSQQATALCGLQLDVVRVGARPCHRHGMSS
jgi:hypothetical protein